jgi:hypothetical protein
MYGPATDAASPAICVAAIRAASLAWMPTRKPLALLGYLPDARRRPFLKLPRALCRAYPGIHLVPQVERWTGLKMTRLKKVQNCPNEDVGYSLVFHYSHQPCALLICSALPTRRRRNRAG